MCALRYAVIVYMMDRMEGCFYRLFAAVNAAVLPRQSTSGDDPGLFCCPDVIVDSAALFGTLYASPGVDGAVKSSLIVI